MGRKWARREGDFPALIDPGRPIHRSATWGAADARLRSAAETMRLDRQANQDTRLVLAAEKAALVAWLTAEFGGYGIPLVVLRGNASQTYMDRITDMLADDHRPIEIGYVGDSDPGGWDIERDLGERCIARAMAYGSRITFRRLAVTLDQLIEYDLDREPVSSGNTKAKPMATAMHQQIVDYVDRNGLEWGTPYSDYLMSEYGHAFKSEVAQISTVELTRIVREWIESHVDKAKYEGLKAREDEHRAAVAGAFPVFEGITPLDGLGSE